MMAPRTQDADRLTDANRGLRPDWLSEVNQGSRAVWPTDANRGLATNQRGWNRRDGSESVSLNLRPKTERAPDETESASADLRSRARRAPEHSETASVFQYLQQFGYLDDGLSGRSGGDQGPQVNSQAKWWNFLKRRTGGWHGIRAEFRISGPLYNLWVRARPLPLPLTPVQS